MQGRNLDYGHKKSDSREGAMAKKTLLTMAKDLYELYVLLNDNDDLPQWCHYKLAGSQKDLSTVVDYLSSKIAKHCVDNKINSQELHLEITSAISSNIINESLFDLFKKKRKNDVKAIFNAIRRNKTSGISMFLEDVRKLAAFIDIQGLFREKDRSINYLDVKNYYSFPALRKKIPIEHDDFFESLSFIISKLEGISKVLDRLSKTTSSARISDSVNEISMFRRDAKTDQKSLALKIKLRLAGNGYSKEFFKNYDLQSINIPDIVDILPFEIRTISREYNLSLPEKNKLILEYKNFVDNVIEILKTNIEAEKKFE